MAKVRVRYRGLSDVREITAKQLKEHGIKLSGDLVFHRGNSFAMNIDANDELLEILKRESTFDIKEIKDDGSAGDEIVKATLADDTAVAAESVDATTGQRSRRS